MEPLPDPPAPIADATVEALHVAADIARRDWSYVSALAGGGPIAAFEHAVESYLGATHVLAVSSCTSALHAALIAVDVKAGDHVIVPAYTWPQTVAPVLHAGAVPVFVDIEPERYALDIDEVRRHMTRTTKAIVVVHLYGHPADVAPLRRIADERGIALIEDCAQAMGATINGVSVGRHGHIGCFSLGRGKPVTGGEGGLIATDDTALFERCVGLTQHPIRQHYELWGEKDIEFGLNSRMHPLAAVIAQAELKLLDSRLDRRARFYGELDVALRTVPGIRSRQIATGERAAFYRYCPTFVPAEIQARMPRRVFIEALRAEGVPISEDPVGTPLHQRSFRPFPHRRHRRKLPVTESRCEEIGLTFARYLADAANDSTVAQIRTAFGKVAEHARTLAEHTCPPSRSVRSMDLTPSRQTEHPRRPAFSHLPGKEALGGAARDTLDAVRRRVRQI